MGRFKEWVDGGMGGWPEGWVGGRRDGWVAGGRCRTKGFYKDEVFKWGSIGAVTYEAKKKKLKFAS